MEQAKKLADKLGFDGTLSELKRGIEVEMEHSDTVGDGLETAAKIAMDHLEEDPKYYTKLSAADLTESQWILRRFSGLPTVNESNNGLYDAVETIFQASEDRLSYDYSDARNRKLDTKLQNDSVKALDVLYQAIRTDRDEAEMVWDKVRAKYSAWMELKKAPLPQLPEVLQQKAYAAAQTTLSNLKIEFSELAHSNLNKDAINREIATVKDIETLIEAANILLEANYLDQQQANKSKVRFETEWHEWWNAVMPHALMVKNINEIRTIITNCQQLLKWKAKFDGPTFKLPKGSLTVRGIRPIIVVNDWHIGLS